MSARSGSTEQQRGRSLRAGAAAAASGSSSSSSAPALTYTSFEGNSWRVEFARSGVRVMVDPWLVERLTFGAGTEFAFAGSKRVCLPESLDVGALAAQTDLILLTQVRLRERTGERACVRGCPWSPAHELWSADCCVPLMQSIDDHAHRPTLKLLPKSIPVVGSPSAAKVGGGNISSSSDAAVLSQLERLPLP